MPTKQNVADYTKSFNNRWGTNFSTDFVSETYKSIETTWSPSTGTTVKPGTKTMQQNTDAAIADRISKVGGYQFGDAYAGTTGAQIGPGPIGASTVYNNLTGAQFMAGPGAPGSAYKRTGMADFFTDEAKAQRAAEAKAEQDRRDRAAAQAAEQKRREEAAKSGTTSKSDPYGGAANDGGGAFGGLSDRETESAKGSNPGDKSSWASGGRVGYQEGGETGFVERPEFVGGNQSQPDKVSIADDQPRDVPEGTFVINAAAADFAGRDDIEKMIREAYQKVGDTGQSGVSQEVQIAVSKGEVLIPPHIAKIIGYDRLNKINNRGKKEISRRQKAEADRPQVDRPVPVNKGGFISKKRFHKGGGVGHSHAAQSDPSSRSNFQVEMDELIKKQDEQANRQSQTPSLNTPGEKLRYRKGVEFGDIEVYADILGKTNYNSLIQAAARDTRTLSDYVKTLPQGEEVASYWDKPLGQYREGAYSEDILNKGPYDSGIVIKNPAFFSNPDGAPKKGYTAVLAHELMHKGADTLSKDPNFKPSEALVAMQRQYSKIPTIIDEGGTEAAKQRVSQGDANTGTLHQS